MKTRILTLLLLVVFAATNTLAQDIADTTAFPVNAVIFLKDGTQLRGILLSESPVGARIRTDNLGELTITADKIERIEKNDEGFYSKGVYWFPNPNYSRYFFAPSALPLSKGEGYYQNAYLFINSVSVGVTDHFTIGGGFLLNPAFRYWGAAFLTPKLSFPSQSNITFAVGAIVAGAYFRNFGLFNSDREVSTFFGGIGYGAVTFGNKEKNGSIGLGWGFANGNIGSRPTVNLSYMSRVGRRVGLVTENWIFIPGQNASAVGILSGGVRFFGEKISADAGLLVPASKDIGFFIAYPYVDFVVKFGKKKKNKRAQQKVNSTAGSF